MKHTIITRNPNSALPGLVQIATTNYRDWAVIRSTFEPIWGRALVDHLLLHGRKKQHSTPWLETAARVAQPIELFKLPGNSEPEDLRPIGDYYWQNRHCVRWNDMTEVPLSLRRYSADRQWWFTLLGEPVTQPNAAKKRRRIPKATIKKLGTPEE